MVAKKFIQACFIGFLALGTSSTALADNKTRNAIIGAGLGGVAGALLSEGDPLYTLGTAAAGGVLGHVITEDDHRPKHPRWDRDRRHQHDRHHHRKHENKRHKHDR